MFSPKLHFKQSAFCLLHEASNLKKEEKSLNVIVPFAYFMYQARAYSFLREMRALFPQLLNTAEWFSSSSIKVLNSQM